MPGDRLVALVVDDDPVARKMVGFSLEQEGFHCTYAIDGVDAMRRMAIEAFDLVVTDLRMPNKHGHSLSIELLARDNPPMVIVHSSIDDPRLTKDLMTRGVDDVVYKPANYPAFAAKARVLVERRKASREMKSMERPAERVPEQLVERVAEQSVEQANGPNDAKQEGVSSADRTPTIRCPIPSIGRGEYERRLRNIQHLFPLSSAAYEVFVLSNSEATTTRKLVSIMLQDAALTADVLRLANSPFYGRRGAPTIDVEEAVVRIGFKKVGEVALALNALAAMRSCIVPWLDANLGQARSLAASIALERLCETRDYRTANDGMTLCAFLQPLGRLVLGSAFQDEYQTLIRECHQREVALSDFETVVFPESHTAALGRVLSQWNVPGDVWGPLCHLGDTYDQIGKLEEPLRSRVEMIKMAVLVGDIAVGRWMPWDLIEVPPAIVLLRHQLTDLDHVIELTRADLGQLVESRRFSSTQDSGKTAHGPTDSLRRFAFRRLADRGGNWVRLLLDSLGVEMLPEGSGDDGVIGLVLDGLYASSQDILAAARDANSGTPKPLFIAGMGKVEWEADDRPICLPSSVAAVRSRLEQYAKEVSCGAPPLRMPVPGFVPSNVSYLA